MICKQCGSEFSGRKKKYCTNECRRNYDNTLHNIKSYGDRICELCGGGYTAKFKTQRYCSEMCGIKGAGAERAKNNPNRVIVDGITMKRCSKCKKMEPLDREHYYRSAKSFDGFMGVCRACGDAKHAEYRKTPNYKTYKKRNYIRTLPWRKEYQEKTKPIRRSQEAERRRADVHFNIKNRMRCLIFSSLKRGKGGKKWSDLLDYSPADLKAHLEKRFTKGMTWKKFLNGEIHIDHKIPVSAFNFTTVYDIDFRRCWAISNLQPMWAGENISKSNKLFAHFQPALGLAVGA